MTATFKLRPDELNEGFLASLREMFARKDEINISVSDSEIEETYEFALAEAQRRSIAVKRGEMKTVDGPEALARVRKLVTP